MERGECRPNALALFVGDQAEKDLSEVRMPGARVDVLPPVRPEKGGFDVPGLDFVDRAAARRHEVSGVGCGLGSQDAVHRGDQLDELVDRPVACLRREFSIDAYQFELVEDRVLAFLLPVEEEHVLEQLRELGVGSDALAYSGAA